MPKGGFGNPIALPLQKQPREVGRSVFVDEPPQPYPDQWTFLASVRSYRTSVSKRWVIQFDSIFGNRTAVRND